MHAYQFAIQSMTCAYQPGKPVLVVENIQIPRGKLVFVIGLSGIGKSTLIEALGLMNNIFDHEGGKNSILFNTTDGLVQELCSLWKGGNRHISEFRNRYFSFIFQNTNLMENFTAGENMCISQLISGKSLAQAKAVVLKVMEKLSLPEQIFDRRITELSGGQRQRLAFVRAITAEFEVLFGDEPTGNLDKDTGYRLMQILKNTLIDSNRTGIIVSHDLDLAIQFADNIVLLTPAPNGQNEYYGTIETQNFITKEKNGWYTDQHTLIDDPINHIINTLRNSIPAEYEQ